MKQFLSAICKKIIEKYVSNGHGITGKKSPINHISKNTIQSIIRTRSILINN